MKKSFFLFAFVLLFNFSGISQNAESKTHIIEIRSMKFNPSELVVQRNDVVKWINKDIVLHNATEKKTAAWASPTLDRGDSWEMTVTESAEYFCTLHVAMTGKITVKKNKTNEKDKTEEEAF
ncbi:MAG TPA: plastocyanin/azurin family copper-binding protein [Salinimicrobium sp.]|nr:plastocyanin/azurin family copper-binding protein [Salinimicrobium sp.]